MEKMKMQSADLTEQNISKLETLFPNCITETAGENGKIKKAVNFDLLRVMLSGEIAEGNENYEFTWPGKKACIAEANRPIRKTLRPCKEESVSWDTTQNLYLEGDNLEVLKLLQESYLGKVKMIYIDPPYNTGNDFIYRDHFAQSAEEYAEESGQFNQEGGRLFKNNDVNGRFHSDWCSMIYPRILLARNLLAENGAIFISIDDNESTNLTKICDEIFGSANRIALICHKSRASVSNDKIISPNHNIILFYAKDIQVLEKNRKRIGLDPILKDFDCDDHDGKGSYRLVPVDGPGGEKKGNPYYEFMGITGYWRFSKEKMQKKYDEGTVVKKGNSLYQKYYRTTAEHTRRTATTWWDDVSLTSTATSKLKELMGEATFDTPKPLQLIDKMLRMMTVDDADAIVMDFFAGSSTTAHAVMNYNAETNGRRKFILIQLPELCAEKSQARKNGWTDICQIGKERIRKAAEKIKADTNAEIDYGFRVFKLDDSNMKDVYYSPAETSQDLLSGLENNIKPDRTDLDLLFGCLLDWGLPISMPYQSEQIGDVMIHSYHDNDLIACFSPDISEDVITAIAERQPLRAVFRDDSFADSPSKINVNEIFKNISPGTQVEVI